MIQLTLSNMMEMFSAFAPFMLAFFLIMSSIFNQNIKGFVYLAGVLMASIINIFIMNQVGSPVYEDRAFTCDILALPLMGAFNSPAPSSVFISFTVAYLLLPMQFNEGQMNYSLLAALLALLGVDTVTQIKNKCSSMAGTFFGILIGFLLGTFWYSLFHQTGYDSLLFFNETISNNTMCSRPSKQSFKCSVYKGGQLLSSNTV